MTFFEKVEYLGRVKGISMSLLAQKIDISRSSITNWKSMKEGELPRVGTIKKVAEFFNVDLSYFYGDKYIPIEDEVEINDNNPVPIVGRVVAGMPIESEEHIEGYIYINYKPKEDYFALRVHGDSMINAGIREGSILVVRKQSHAESGDIVVALLNGEQTVKRFKVYSNTPFLMPENPAYDPIPIPEGSDLVILGKVVEVRFAF